MLLISKIRKIQKALQNIHPVEFESLNEEQTIRHIIEEEKSLIRFGDGEVSICNGRGIYFQCFDKELQLRLIKILESYSNDSPYLLAAPNEFLTGWLFSMPLLKILMWAESRSLMRQYLKRNLIVGDAFLFRKKIICKEMEHLKIYRLWEKFQNIVCVGGNISNNHVMSLFPLKKIKVISVSSKHAFKEWEKTYFEIIEFFKGPSALKKQDTVILISAGPVGKVLAFELSMSGYIVHDVGFFLNPVPILKKYGLVNRTENVHQ